MVRDSDNRELDKEEVERKRLHDEMMTSIRAQNEKSLKLREEAAISSAKKNAAVEKDNKYYAISFPIAILISIVSFSSLGVIKGALISIALFVIVLIGSFFMDKTEKPPENSNSPHMKCPHCETIGQINTKKVDLTKGISGGKAVAGLLTGGLSILAVGISREETQTEARCGKCGNVWHF